MPPIFQGKRKMDAEDRSSYVTQILEGYWEGLSPLVIKRGDLWRLSEEGTRGICWKGLSVAVWPCFLSCPSQIFPGPKWFSLQPHRTQPCSPTLFVATKEIGAETLFWTKTRLILFERHNHYHQNSVECYLNSIGFKKNKQIHLKLEFAYRGKLLSEVIPNHFPSTWEICWLKGIWPEHQKLL